MPETMAIAGCIESSSFSLPLQISQIPLILLLVQHIYIFMEILQYFIQNGLNQNLCYNYPHKNYNFSRQLVLMQHIHYICD
jgi:hypothetical protein